MRSVREISNWGLTVITNYLLTESEVCTGNIKLRSCCIVRAMARWKADVKTEFWRLISILLHGIFSENYNNTVQMVILHFAHERSERAPWSFKTICIDRGQDRSTTNQNAQLQYCPCRTSKQCIQLKILKMLVIHASLLQQSKVMKLWEDIIAVWHQSLHN